jgi:hypothetical protein
MSSQATYGFQMHDIPLRLIEDESAFERAVEAIYPDGVTFKYYRNASPWPICNVQAKSNTGPADLLKHLQDAEVIMKE